MPEGCHYGGSCRRSRLCPIEAGGFELLLGLIAST